MALRGKPARLDWSPARASDGEAAPPDQVQAFLEVGAEGAVVSVTDEAELREVARVRAGLYTNVEIHDWQFGGRR